MSSQKPKTYQLPPTRLIPNSPDPLLYYPAFFAPSDSLDSVYEHFSSNTWTPQWIFRYGATQDSHYHSRTHECMAVLSGRARIRFGVADAEKKGEREGGEEGREGEGEAEGVEIEASAGDVFVLPAGVAHKTFAPQPEVGFALLTPSHRGFAKEEAEGTVLEGFTMMGAYPRGSSDWDFQVGGEDVGAFDKVWGTRRPERDPVLGTAREGLLGLWRE